MTLRPTERKGETDKVVGEALGTSASTYKRWKTVDNGLQRRRILAVYAALIASQHPRMLLVSPRYQRLTRSTPRLMSRIQLVGGARTGNHQPENQRERDDQPNEMPQHGDNDHSGDELPERPLHSPRLPPATGVSEGTVRNDLSDAQNYASEPEALPPVTGLDEIICIW